MMRRLRYFRVADITLANRNNKTSSGLVRAILACYMLARRAHAKRTRPSGKTGDNIQ